MIIDLVEIMLKIKYIEFFIVFIYLSAVVFGLKEFTIWSQITEWLAPNNMKENIQVATYLIATEHPHMLRILLVVPFYALSEYLTVDIDLFFSLVLVLLIYGIYLLNLAILKDTVERKKVFILLLFFLLLSLVMHGRIVFSILGNTMLLYLLYRSFYTNNKLKKYKSIPLFLMALWFSSVSSGTFVVFLLTIFINYFLHSLVKLPYVSQRIVWLFSFFIMLLLILSPMIIIFVEKNINYYDGSIINMLSHGAGGYLIDYLYVVLPLLAILILSLPIVIFYLRRYNFLILPLSMILSSLVVGLFGFSSLVSGVSAYLIFIYMFVNRSKIKAIQYV
jgi:hypothetical protein